MKGSPQKGSLVCEDEPSLPGERCRKPALLAPGFVSLHGLGKLKERVQLLNTGGKKIFPACGRKSEDTRDSDHSQLLGGGGGGNGSVDDLLFKGNKNFKKCSAKFKLHTNLSKVGFRPLTIWHLVSMWEQGGEKSSKGGPSQTSDKGLNV